MKKISSLYLEKEIKKNWWKFTVGILKIHTSVPNPKCYFRNMKQAGQL